MPPRVRLSSAPVANTSHSKRLKNDISSTLASILLTQPQLTPSEAVWKARDDLLKNNPFVPPKDGKCIINGLPNELLAHIFRVGMKMQKEELEDGLCEGEDDDVDEISLDAAEDETPLSTGDSTARSKRSFKSANVDDGDADQNLVVEDDGDDGDWEDEPSSDDDSNAESDDDEEPVIPFQVLVSHVCRHWRNCALDTADLWASIMFLAPPKWDKYNAYIERAKGQPLDILIEGTIPDNYLADEHPDHPDFQCDESDNPHHRHDDAPFFSMKQCNQIMDVISPKVSQWHALEVSVTEYKAMHALLQSLHELPAAPILETLQLHHYEDCDEYDKFKPEDLRLPSFLPFHGEATRLKKVSLWGVHIDWDGAIPMFQNLTDFELAYHTKDVRPSWKAFSSYIQTSSSLRTLQLVLSGPSLDNPALLPLIPSTPFSALPSALPSALATPGYQQPGQQEAEDPYAWPQYALELPSLKELSLAYHEPLYAHALLTHLVFPNIINLAIDYEDGDFTEVVRALTRPLRIGGLNTSAGRSVLSGLEYLKVDGLGFVQREAVGGMVEKLIGVKQLCLDCGLEDGEDDDDDVAGSVPGQIWRVLVNNLENVWEWKKKEQQGVSNSTNAVDGATTTTTSSGAPVPAPLNLPSISLSAPPTTIGNTSHEAAALLCPNLTTLTTTAIVGAEMRRFVDLRIKVGAPLKKVEMCDQDLIQDQDERWLRDHLEEFDFFEDSDAESYVDTDQDSESGRRHDHSDADDDDDEDDDEEDDFEEEDYDGDDDEGRVRRHGRLHGANTRGGAASTSVTTGLENLD